MFNKSINPLIDHLGILRVLFALLSYEFFGVPGYVAARPSGLRALRKYFWQILFHVNVTLSELSNCPQGRGLLTPL